MKKISIIVIIVVAFIAAAILSDVGGNDIVFSGTIEGDTLTLYAGDKGELPYGIYDAKWRYNLTIEHVIIDKSMQKIHPKTLERLFDGLVSLKDIEGLENLNTDECKDFYGMFRRCKSLTSFDMTNMNVKSGRNFAEMFNECTSISYIGTIEFGCELERVSCMFMDCKNLRDVSLKLSYGDNIDGIYGMFYGCESIEKIDMIGFNMSSIVSCESAFAGCFNLKELRLGDCSNVKKFEDIVRCCIELETVRAYNPSSALSQYLNEDGISVEAY